MSQSLLAWPSQAPASADQDNRRPQREGHTAHAQHQLQLKPEKKSFMRSMDVLEGQMGQMIMSFTLGIQSSA